MGMAHSRGGGGSLCLCLIALYQNILLCDHGQACLPTLVLKDIVCWRTINWELGSLGRVHTPPCHETLSSCLDVWQIKGRWKVTMIGWVINALFLRCVCVRGTAVGVVAPVGVTIHVTGLSDLVGGSTGRSVCLWCRQISARGLTVV